MERKFYDYIDVTGKVEELYNAIQNICDGGIVKLDAGSYYLENRLIIEKSLTLIGKGIDNTILIITDDDGAVLFEGNYNWIVRDIHFECNISSCQTNFVTFIGGTFCLQNCSFLGNNIPVNNSKDDEEENNSSGVLVFGESSGMIRGSKFFHNDIGINVSGKAVVSIFNNESVSNNYGVVISNKAHGFLESNRFNKNSIVGIKYKDSASGIARNNECIKNGSYGIKISNEAHPNIENNFCNYNQFHGIIYSHDAFGNAINNKCEYNGSSGIEISDSAYPILENNNCIKNVNGIVYKSNSKGIAFNNNCFENKDNGILVGVNYDGDTKEEILLRAIFGDELSNPSPIIITNQCSYNANGINYEGNARGKALSNSCNYNQYNGMIYQNNTSGHAVNNECKRNRLRGVIVADEAKPILKFNRYIENSEGGILYIGKSSGKSIKNECKKNKSYCILIKDNANPFLIENDCDKDIVNYNFKDEVDLCSNNIRCESGEVNVYKSFEFKSKDEEIISEQIPLTDKLVLLDGTIIKTIDDLIILFLYPSYYGEILIDTIINKKLERWFLKKGHESLAIKIREIRMSNQKNEVILKRLYATLISNNKDLYPFEKNKKYGYINIRGEVIIEEQFDYGGIFQEGFASIKQDRKWGFINLTGDIIIPPVFDLTGNISEGIAKVNIGYKIALSSNKLLDQGKWGFIDINGSYIVKPKFDLADSYNKGLAIINMGYKQDSNNLFKSIEEGKYGFIDIKGNFVTDISFDEAYSFSEGFAVVKVNGKYGFINTKGNYFIKPIFHKARKFSEDKAAVRYNHQNSWCYISTNGETVIPNNKLYAVDSAESFYENRALVTSEGFNGFINEYGESLGKSFIMADAFSEGFANVMPLGSGSGWNFIDRNGGYLTGNGFDDANSFIGGLARVKLNNKYGYINRNGEVVIDFLYDDASNFYRDLTLVRLKDKIIYINKKGEHVYIWTNKDSS